MFFGHGIGFCNPPFSSRYVFKEVRVAWRVALSDRAEASVVCGCVFFRKIAVFRLLKKKKR